jgi:hypothetical protein
MFAEFGTKRTIDGYKKETMPAMKDFAKNSLNYFSSSKAKLLGQQNTDPNILKDQTLPNQPEKLIVANDKVIMDNFLGVNAVYHGFAYFPHTTGAYPMTDENRKEEFSRVQSMDLKIARAFFRPNWTCRSSIYSNFDWETDKMQALYAWLDKMKQLKVQVALQAGWFFPGDTYLGHTIPDSTKDVARYASWITQSLKHLINVKGYNNIKYLMLLTEPLNNPSKLAPYAYRQPEYYAKVCTEINDSLIKAGLRSKLKLVGPNSGSTDTAAYVGWSVGRLNKVIDIYSWHTYNGGSAGNVKPLEYEGWRNIVEAGRVKVAATGKPFWIDEYGANRPKGTVRTTADYGNYLAQCVAAFTNSGAQTSLLWLLFDQKYEGNTTNNDGFSNGVQRVGLVKYSQDTLKNPGKPFPAFYAFSMMSKYMGGRTPTRTYKTYYQDSLYTVATQSGNNLSVMVVNAHHSARKFEVHFNKAVNCGFKKYLYDPANVQVSPATNQIESHQLLKNITNSLQDNIPARGVTIYTSVASGK